MMKKTFILTMITLSSIYNSYAFDATKKIYTKSEAKADKEYYESRGDDILKKIERAKKSGEPYIPDSKEIETSNNFKEMLYNLMAENKFDTLTGITVDEAKRALDNKLILIGDIPEYLDDLEDFKIGGVACDNIALIRYQPDKNLSLTEIAQIYRQYAIHEMMELIFQSENRTRLCFEGGMVWATLFLSNFNGEDLNTHSFNYHAQSDIVEGIMAVIGGPKNFYDCTKMPGGGLDKLKKLFEKSQDIISFDIVYGYLVYSYQASQRDEQTHIFNDVNKNSFDSYKNDSDFVKFLKSIPNAKTQKEIEALRSRALYFKKILERDYNMLLKISDDELAYRIGNYPLRIKKFRLAANNEYNLKIWGHEHPSITEQTDEAFAIIKNKIENRIEKSNRIREKIKKTTKSMDFYRLDDKNRFTINIIK